MQNKLFRDLTYTLVNELRIWNPQSHSGIKIGLGKQETLEEPQVIDEEKLAKEISTFKQDISYFLKEGTVIPTCS